MERLAAPHATNASPRHYGDLTMGDEWVTFLNPCPSFPRLRPRWHQLPSASARDPK